MSCGIGSYGLLYSTICMARIKLCGYYGNSRCPSIQPIIYLVRMIMLFYLKKSVQRGAERDDNLHDPLAYAMTHSPSLLPIPIRLAFSLSAHISAYLIFSFALSNPFLFLFSNDWNILANSAAACLSDVDGPSLNFSLILAMSILSPAGEAGFISGFAVTVAVWPNRFIAAKAASRLAPNGRCVNELLLTPALAVLLDDDDEPGLLLVNDGFDEPVCFARSLAKRGLEELTEDSLVSSCCCDRDGPGVGDESRSDEQLC